MPANNGVAWHRSIRFHLVVAAVVIEIFMLSLLLGNSFRLISDALEQQTRNRVEALVPLLNASLNGNVFQRNYTEIQSILDQLVRAESTDIRYLAVFDKNGQRLAVAGRVAQTLPQVDNSVEQALSDLIYDTEVKLTLLGENIGMVRFGLDLTQMVTLRDSVVLQGFIIAAIEILLSLLLLATGGYLITRHITRLLAVTRRVARGDYASRISVPSRDEIGLLAGNFNTMAAAIEQRVRELQDSENRFRDIFDSVGEAIFVHDIDSGRILDVNRCMLEMYQCTREDALSATPDSFSLGTPPYSAAEALAWIQKALREGPQTFEWQARRMSGETFWAEVNLRTTELGGQTRLLAVVRDISERKRMEDALRQAASVFEHANEGIMIADGAGRIIEVNAAFSDITGFARDEAIGHKPSILSSGRHDRDFYEQMWSHLLETGFWRGEIWNRRKDGALYAELLTITAMRDASGRIHQYVGLFSDITEIKDNQHRLEHMAHYDALTRLPNRILLADRLGQAIAQAVRTEKLLAVAYLDLDGFKPVNDTLGHEAGDQLLIEAARRFSDCIRAGDTACRLGGDEFVLLVSSLSTLDECGQVFDRILAAVKAPFRIGGGEVCISASIGITVFPLDDADPDTLLRHADQAMYLAKQGGRGRYHLFDSRQDRLVEAQHEARARIEDALRRNEFVLHYQPKVNMCSGKVVGVEALIRWRHPERGMVAPGEFLPAIEETDFAVTLGRWVMDAAVAQLDAWRKAGMALNVSINMAARHLQTPGFINELELLLNRYPDVPPAAIELEVLETAAIEDIVEAATIIHAGHALGLRFALDDFGTGYSSMSYFKRLGVDTLKIDQSFVRDMLDDEGDRAIVEGMIGLAQVFGREVIAEGVETIEIGETLVRLGCELAQGYGIARPMPAAEMPAWMGEWQGRTGWKFTAR
ncbi:MAG: EAL domain-containing protein [Gammaproteobacteria bacterium]|nr:EAL domain-containing protein [Gammaproteobacteria bacterium]MBU1646625.1 EAL domain-containing protein [Gammaproteobacteria bacterium]MBU1972882.1 EAL domain-containing protein [Gammaproteobacteria bacterium]